MRKDGAMLDRTDSREVWCACTYAVPENMACTRSEEGSRRE